MNADDISTNWPTGYEQMTDLAQSALAMHVMFTSLVEGGFNERQALLLLAEMVKHNPPPPK